MRRFPLWLAICAMTHFLLAPSLRSQNTAPQKPAKTAKKHASTLAQQIHHQILALPFYSVFDFLSFALDGGKVTLTGQVVRPTLKADAEAAVKSMEGVITVTNNIEVLPVSPADDELRRTVYRAIYEDSVLASYAVQALPAIHILVKNGNVSLEGVVTSDAHKDRATQRAQNVANVLSLDNNLVVQPKGSAAE